MGSKQREQRLCGVRPGKALIGNNITFTTNNSIALTDLNLFQLLEHSPGTCTTLNYLQYKIFTLTNFSSFVRHKHNKITKFGTNQHYSNYDNLNTNLQTAEAMKLIQQRQ